MHIAFLAVALLALLVVSRLGSRIVALLAMRGLANRALKAVGDTAINRQPDEIHLSPTHGETVRAPLEQFAATLSARGFTDGGFFAVAEIPGLIIHFMLDVPNSVYAGLYDHPKAGCMAELVTRYQDGNGITYCMRRDSGMEPRPGDIVVHAPDVPLDALYDRMLRERPKRPMVAIDSSNAPRLFEQAWAQQVRWRKQRGGDSQEVARIILARQAAKK